MSTIETTSYYTHCKLKALNISKTSQNVLYSFIIESIYSLTWPLS